MKKMIAALFAAVLMAAGLVVATGGAASADCTPTQYSGCVVTDTEVSAPDTVAKKQKATVCAKVDAKNSNAKPTGTVTFKVARNKGGFFWKDTVSYSGSKVCVTTPRLKQKGGYTVTAAFKSPKGSTFMNSSDSTGFDVAK